MRSSSVRLVVVGGTVALLVIWLGIRPGRTRPALPTRSDEAARGAVAPAEHGSRRLPASAGATAGRRDVPSEGARAPEPTAPMPDPPVHDRAPRPAPGAAATGEIDMNVNPPKDIPTLGRIALTDPDPQRRAAAGVLLAATENPQAVPLLHQALSDVDAEVRHTLVKEIAELD